MENKVSCPVGQSVILCDGTLGTVDGYYKQYCVVLLTEDDILAVIEK